MSTPTVASITGELPEAISKYGRKYGWRQRAHGREFRGTWPRNSSDQNLILWRSHEIRWFEDHNTEAPHSVVDTGAPDGPNFAAVPRNFLVVVAENFGAPRSGPEIPECSSLRIYNRIPRLLLVIHPVIARICRSAQTVTQ